MRKRGFREVTGMRRWPQKAGTWKEEEEIHDPGMLTGSQRKGTQMSVNKGLSEESDCTV